MGRTSNVELLRAAEPLIELAVAEDIGPGDVTSEATLDPETSLTGCIVAKEAGVIAGLGVAEHVFHHVNPEIRFTSRAHDGQEVVAGEIVAEVQGPAPSLLAAERLALNFLQRMSGIATTTRDYADAVAVTRATILDTRKTVPGHRLLDKYAVRMGGGVNHRMALFDMVLIKDNHIVGAGGITPAVARARTAHPDLPIEVEVRTLDELREALSITPPLDRIMLDNMSLAAMRKAVEVAGGRVPLEASGNVSLDTVADIAAAGVDYISVGALTHSVGALDLSMDVRAPSEETGVPDPVEHIRDAKAALNQRLVVLGHHYQRDEVIEFADYRGDSLQLARQATEIDAEYIVFCGVHFMAEVAAILAQPGQHVLIPDPSAGCYLADTATLGAVQAAWEALDTTFDDAGSEFTPITYVNSSAALKAFCGKHGGIMCTSGNAPDALRWALERRPRVFFFPDQHLGRNTAAQLGIPPAEMAVWDQGRPLTDEVLRETRVLLWPGACNVHQRFRPSHVRTFRAHHPQARVIVHPECTADVVSLADDAGSTAHIIRQVAAGPPGTIWAVGTETRLVQRLQSEHPDQTVVPLADVPPYCATMTQITLENLAAVLDGLTHGKLHNEVTVDEETARWAKVALERMLAL
ncbi:MAG: quinolinate synthase NadA [Chloroflexota bacterium]|nr:quinolinate synthase NadA [Chloroflexota bacterium]